MARERCGNMGVKGKDKVVSGKMLRWDEGKESSMESRQKSRVRVE